MLGEAAMTMADAERYYAAYVEALEAVARQAGDLKDGDTVFARPSLSVKLSAIHPRYQAKAKDRLLAELMPRLIALAQKAKAANLGLTIDAEEMDRLDLQLEVFARLRLRPSLPAGTGWGLRCRPIRSAATRCWNGWPSLPPSRRKLPVRLVKGAYWDTEIKRAQELGLDGYPVFTRKVCTDVSYLACAKLMLGRRDVFYPQFATHNAHTVAAVSVMAGPSDDYEFQRLHGMGQALYGEVLGSDKLDRPCRIYAPVGSHEDLLAYLVRRLLENGANTSFVNRLADDEAPIEEIIADPVREIEKLERIPHPSIPLPSEIFAPRVNSRGLPLWDDATRQPLDAEIRATLAKPVSALPIVAGKAEAGEAVRKVTSPQDRRATVGEVSEATSAQIDQALKAAHGAQVEWDRLGGAERARILEKASDLYEKNTSRLMALLIGEAGKTFESALADLREAVDFLRYYAERARAEFTEPLRLGGPTGEGNELMLAGRGVFVCISPWNFPLAIFTGQMSAALAAGNAVIAKPAEQTPLVAFEAVKLLHQAGVPGEVLSLLPGDGARLGGQLLADPRVTGVAFTGSNETAAIIHRALAERDGPIVPLIAETGGMNAMIVDSSALPEQAVRDVVISAFDSAGQRCSAARILFVQEDIADRLIDAKGAIAELKVGDPLDYATDVGPVIDEEARRGLDAHKERMGREARTIIDLELRRRPAMASSWPLARMRSMTYQR
jgi:RHH-type transcriptional regulator, proline utilization regulon repressor / proline dehydrogenase / delta 1-pyrroline-5-carboxylate dehydrogenase